MYCTQCGTPAVPGGRFCANCGHPHGGAAPVATVVEPVFAGFWLRAGAFLIDWGILGAIAYFGLVVSSMIALGMTVGLTESSPPENPFAALEGFAWLWLLFAAVPWLYHALFASSRRQATPGKMACGLKLTSLSGERIGFGRATARYFASWLTSLTFLVGYLTVAFTRKRQSLHDLIARTVVVGAKVEPAQVAGAAPAQQLSGWVVALIAAGCSIFPLGILAAIAIPAYHDYTIRSQVVEGIQLAADYKAGVEAYLDDNGRWPESEADLADRASLEQSVAGSRTVDSIEVWNGTVVIAYGPKANPRIREHLVSLRPFVTDEGRVVWQCGNASLEDSIGVEARPKGEGATDSDVGVTSVVDRYLPSACRTDHQPSDEGDG